MVSSLSMPSFFIIRKMESQSMPESFEKKQSTLALPFFNYISNINLVKATYRTLEDNILINNKFFTWLNNQRSFVRAGVFFVIVFHAYWLGFFIRDYLAGV